MAAANKAVPKAASKDHEFQAIVDILSRLGDKWTIMIVSELAEGPMRYGELQRRIGLISQRMLTLTLKGLTQDGLVSRTVFPTIPPRVDYELTKLGFGLRASLMPFCQWASENLQVMAASRTAGLKPEVRTKLQSR
jgi:DNA-binding HxlR family transcriptional regulator